jgi:hypothetical protein
MLSFSHGDASQRAHSAVAEAVFDCYDKGHKRARGERALQKLSSEVAELRSSRATADLWAGLAFSHALACRWDQVSQPVQTSLEYYQEVSDSRGFEVAHTRWLDLWANWNLGRWDAMQRVSDDMFEDATRRNDLFQQLVTSGGYGGAAWLAQDKIDELSRIRAANEEFDCNQNQTQMFHVFDWISSIQCLLYQGEFLEAWSRYKSMEPSLRRVPYSKMQLIRVTRQSLGALVALHNLTDTSPEPWISRTKRLTHQLRQEQNCYATVLANLYEGLLEQKIERLRRAAGGFDGAGGFDVAGQLLLKARDESRDAGLLPYQLAAEDALAEIHTGQPLELLIDRMRDQNVVRPTHLQRLYTVAAE